MTVDFLYQFTNTLILKNQMPTYSPDNFFYIWNSEQRSFMGDVLGRFQPRANSKSGVNTGLIENERILTMLRPFVKLATITLSSGTGSLPSDFIYLLAARRNTSKVYYVNKGQWYSVQRSVIDPPSVVNDQYYFTDYATGLAVLPASVPSIDIDYVGDCVDVKWGFTVDPTTGLPIYSPGASVQPLWGPLEVVEITKRTMKSIGVRFGSRDFENFGQTAINTGS